MIRLGRFFFRYRNAIAPFFFLLIALDMVPILQQPQARAGLIVAGLLIAIAGQALRAVAIGLVYIIRGGGRRKAIYADKLVTSGAFAHSRNPLYLGNILIVSGVAVAANSRLFLVFGVPALVFAFCCIIAAEEHFLRAKFGDAYEQYCRRVNRFLPRFAGIGETFRSMTFNWTRVILKDYQTIYAWTAGMTVLVWQDVWIASRRAGESLAVWSFAAVLLLLTLAFLTAWFLKKMRLLRTTG